MNAAARSISPPEVQTPRRSVSESVSMDDLMAVFFLIVFAASLGLASGPGPGPGLVPVFVLHEGLHESLEHATRRVAKEPKNARFLLDRAELFRLHRDHDRALEDCASARRLDSSLPRIDLVEGLVLREMGRLKDAQTALTRHLASCPRDGRGYLARAEVYIRLGKTPAAVHDYSQAIAWLHAPQPEHYLKRSALLLERIRDPEAALRGLDAGIARLGSVVSLELEAIEIERSLERFDSALSRLSKLTDRARRKEHWIARRADLLKEAGRAEESAAAYRECLAAIESLSPKIRALRTTRKLEVRVSNALANRTNGLLREALPTDRKPKPKPKHTPGKRGG